MLRSPAKMADSAQMTSVPTCAHAPRDSLDHHVKLVSVSDNLRAKQTLPSFINKKYESSF